MDDQRSHLVLVNPSAGGGRARELLPLVEGALRDHDIGHRLMMTTSLDHGIEEARRAAQGGEVVVVMSGDGLIGQIGGVLAGTGVPLGGIPGGRGNDFARGLGLPTEIRDGVAVIANGETRKVDVGEVNGRRFLGIASCGFDSDVNRIANETRFIKGNLVYLYATLRGLAAWKPARFEVTLDGERRAFTGFAVAAANSRAYGGGMFLAPDAELDDGRLDVVPTGDASNLHCLANLPKVFSGRHVEDEAVTVVRASEVEITADRPFAVYADGDHLADLPARIKLLPRALDVIARPGALVGPRPR